MTSLETTSHASGNTKPSACVEFKARSFLFTLNQVEKYGTKVNIVKYVNSFWQGVGNAKIAIYDDFRDSHMHPSEFINFIDYNKHTINIKGGEKQNEYSLIIITSVQDPHYIYMGMKDDEPRRQWLRRMTIVDMNPLPKEEEPATISEDIDFELI